MLSKLPLSNYFTAGENGQIVLLPQLNAQELPTEKFDPKPWKCATRNTAFTLAVLQLKTCYPRVMIIDSAANISAFHLVAGFQDEPSIDIISVSHSVKWDAYMDDRVSVTPLSSTFDAYTHGDQAFDAIFLDACGNAPLLLGDICGINIEGEDDYVSAFESFDPNCGGVFGITWSNTR